MVSYSSLYARSKNVKIPAGRWRMKRPERLVYLILGAALSPVTIPWLERVRVFPVAIGHPMVIAVGIVAVFANVWAIEQLHITMKTIRTREAEQKLKQQADEEIVAHELPHGPAGH